MRTPLIARTPAAGRSAYGSRAGSGNGTQRQRQCRDPFGLQTSAADASRRLPQEVHRVENDQLRKLIGLGSRLQMGFVPAEALHSTAPIPSEEIVTTITLRLVGFDQQRQFDLVTQEVLPALT